MSTNKKDSFALPSLKWRGEVRLLSQSNAGGLLLLIVVTGAVYQTVGEGFLSSFNLFTISQLAAEATIIGFAQLMLIVLGRMNIAVGAIGLCVAMVTGWLIGVVGINPAVGIVAGLIFGAAQGAFMGWLELKTGLKSFIVTLAMQSVYVGVVLIISQGLSVNTLPQSITDFGIHTLFVPALSLHVIPALVVAVLVWCLYRRSTLGWKMLAVGANQEAAELSGVAGPQILIMSFTFSGLLAGVAGIMEMSRVSAALPSQGTDWLLTSFIVPVLGGSALAGGSVSVLGAVLAAVFIETINAGLVSLDVAPYWQQFAQSAILLVAVVGDQARRSVQSRSTLAVRAGSRAARLDGEEHARH